MIIKRKHIILFYNESMGTDYNLWEELEITSGGNRLQFVGTDYNKSCKLPAAIFFSVPLFGLRIFFLLIFIFRFENSSKFIIFSNEDMVICHKLVLKSVSYPKIVENTPILIEQSLACNVYT